MKMTLAELAKMLDAELIGDSDVVVEGVATLANAGPGFLTFLSNRRYFPYLKDTRASAVILQSEFAADCPTHALVCDDAYVAYARAAQALHPVHTWIPGQHSSAIVDPSAEVHDESHVGAGAVVEAHARIGPGAFIGPNCVIGEGASIGPHSHLSASVTLCHGVKLNSSYSKSPR